jgi:dynein light chain LC8-type
MEPPNKPIIKNTDMDETMQEVAIEIARSGLEKHTVEKDIAMFIKKTFDEKYGLTWHCVVGKSFGSFVTHETKHFIYFYIGALAILLFKSG